MKPILEYPKLHRKQLFPKPDSDSEIAEGNLLFKAKNPAEQIFIIIHFLKIKSSDIA